MLIDAGADYLADDITGICPLQLYKIKTSTSLSTFYQTWREPDGSGTKLRWN